MAPGSPSCVLQGLTDPPLAAITVETKEALRALHRAGENLPGPSPSPHMLTFTPSEVSNVFGPLRPLRVEGSKGSPDRTTPTKTRCSWLSDYLAATWPLEGFRFHLWSGWPARR